MSRGPGRIERAITALFAAEPDGAFTVAELALHIYPECAERSRDPDWLGYPCHHKEHEVSILRAVRSSIRKGATLDFACGASRACLGRPVVVFNFVSVMSYGKAWLKSEGYDDAYIAAELVEGGGARSRGSGMSPAWRAARNAQGIPEKRTIVEMCKMKNYLDDPTVPLPLAALLNDIQRAFASRHLQDGDTVDAETDNAPDQA
jgi:hypothetical protein